MLESVRTMQDGLSQIVAEIQNIVEDAATGGFSNKMKIDGKAGYIRTLSELLNQL